MIVTVYLDVSLTQHMDNKLTAGQLARGASRAASKLIPIYFENKGLPWRVFTHVHNSVVSPVMDDASAYGLKAYGRWYRLATSIRTSQSGYSQNVVPSMSTASWLLNTPCIWLGLQTSTTRNEHLGNKCWCHTAGLWSRSSQKYPTANIIQKVGSWYGHH